MVCPYYVFKGFKHALIKATQTKFLKREERGVCNMKRLVVLWYKRVSWIIIEMISLKGTVFRSGLKRLLTSEEVATSV